MSELRQDSTTREWVIIAPERAKRPQQSPKKKEAAELPDWDASCPFCPGNEDQTPDEVLRLPLISKNSEWDLRVVPNRFAALTPDIGINVERNNAIHSRKRPGIGAHEVIIESPSHNTPTALMSYEQVEKILIAYQERYNDLKKNRHFKYITIFKNHGWASGTSLAHAHSQLVATPITATYYHLKSDVAMDYYYDYGRCLYCDLIDEEIQKGERVVAQTNQFVILHPYASRVPYETWILPKRHSASFGLFPAAHLSELAMVLKDSLLCIYKGLDDPAFNYMLDTTTTEDEGDPYYHWHFRILPRLSTIAGFEMGSGIRINTELPEDTCRLMKTTAKSFACDECLSFKQNI